MQPHSEYGHHLQVEHQQAYRTKACAVDLQEGVLKVTFNKINQRMHIFVTRDAQEN
jgi:hypothetical protein